MTTILAAIFVFGVLITVHEFGHFITAKMTGMRVDEFAIGFGPNIFQKKVGETLYSLRIIPLGGYNKIAGMDPEEPDSNDSFKSKSIPARMLVILMVFKSQSISLFWARLWKIRRPRRQACR